MPIPNKVYAIFDDRGEEASDDFFYDIADAEDFVENYELVDCEIICFARMF